MNDHLVYIPFVSGEELLGRAIASVCDEHPTLVIDGSERGILAPFAVDIHRPGRRISFSATMNLALELGAASAVRYLCFLHADGQCVGRAAALALELARRHDDGTLGAVFTNYDVFAVFVLPVLLERVGRWDEGFPWYVADNDYYRRVKLAGLRIEHCPAASVRHLHSQTYRAMSPLAQARVREESAAATARYRDKWGGEPGAERFQAAWNGKLDPGRPSV